MTGSADEHTPQSGGRGGTGPDGTEPDELEEARETVRQVMRGKGGRNALARLQAAKAILGQDWLAGLSDEALLAEVKRRADARAKP